jgi:hypothetical protein
MIITCFVSSRVANRDWVGWRIASIGTNTGLHENIAIRFVLKATVLRISRLTPYTKIYHYLNAAKTDA